MKVDDAPSEDKPEEYDFDKKNETPITTEQRNKIVFVEYWHHFFGLSRLLLDKGTKWKEIAHKLMCSPLVRKMWEGLHNEPGPTQAKVAIRIIEVLYPGSKVLHEGRTIRIGCPAENSTILENAEAFDFTPEDVCTMCNNMYSTYAEEVNAAFSRHEKEKKCQVTFG